MPVQWVLFDWGGTLMLEDGPADLPMALWPEVRPIEGAAEVLAALRPGRSIGVATNAMISDRAMIERALARAGLSAFVSEVFCYRDLGVKKADPAFWDAVIARAEVGRDELIMIGDDLEQDVLAPRRSGIAAVWFNWRRAPGHPGPDVPVIHRLADLPALIR